jgi:putative mRNA 3-end processing factor
VKGQGLFSYDDQVLRVPAAAIGLDPSRAAEFAVVSHAHSDHIARHRSGVASPATVALMAQRLGTCRLEPLPFGEAIERAGHRVWLTPAGHVLGAAQVVVEDPTGQRLVYTGDFSVRPRSTIVPAEPVRADILITECTYGSPQYVFPTDDEVRAQVRAFVERSLFLGAMPVLLGYPLGKAQEAMALVNGLGFGVAIHPSLVQLTEVYRRFGVDLGPSVVYDGRLPPDHVLIAPPNLRGRALPARKRTAFLSGWALDRSAKYRMGVDEAIPLSDHADFAELVAFVEQVQPKKVYTTHGPATFADHLRRLGFDAEHLGTHQPSLF